MAPESPRARITSDTVIAILSILTGVIIWFAIPFQVDEPIALFGQVSAGMSPKLFPQMAAGGFVIIGIAYLVVSGRMASTSGFEELAGEDYAAIGIILVLMTVYVLLLQPLGFVLASGLTALAIALFYGSRNVIGIGLVAIVAPLGIYLLFTRALSVSLPDFFWVAS